MDIYGFESFSENSLEQLCINYANERLQLYFVHHYLRDLQAEYTEERIPWQHVNMTSDNESCVRLMSDNPGIFSLLNEVRSLWVNKVKIFCVTAILVNSKLKLYFFLLSLKDQSHYYTQFTIHKPTFVLTSFGLMYFYRFLIIFVGVSAKPT